MGKKYVEKTKNIALIAHDNKKNDLVEWAKNHKDILARHHLFGTGTTSKVVSENTGLPVRGYKSGPLGGDQQIGAKIAEGKIDIMIFFWDPLTAQPHDPDVKALLRIAVMYGTPVAMNKTSANYLITSPMIDEEYDVYVVEI